MRTVYQTAQEYGTRRYMSGPQNMVGTFLNEDKYLVFEWREFDRKTVFAIEQLLPT